MYVCCTCVYLYSCVIACLHGAKIHSTFNLSTSTFIHGFQIASQLIIVLLYTVMYDNYAFYSFILICIAIELSVKPSLLTSTTTKRVNLKCDKDTITGDDVEVISDLEQLPVRPSDIVVGTYVAHTYV